MRKTKEDASWRNKKAFLNGAAVKNRISGCLLSRDESRKHGNEHIKAVLVDADEYLEHLSRYIHLNPVRARMVEHCRDYFANWVKKTFLSKESNSKEIPQLKILKPRPTPDDLIQAVSNEFGYGMENILRKGKRGI